MGVTTFNSSCSSLFTGYQCNAFLIARIISSSLSIIGSFFLMFVIWLFRKYKTLIYRVLLYIAICSFLNCVTILANDYDNSEDNTWCKITGISLQFNIWALLLWQVCITVHLCLSTMNIHAEQWLEGTYHVVCWGASVIATIIPVVFGKYGPAITWCWISDHQWRIWAFYIEYVALILLMFALYAKVVYTVLSWKPKWGERPTESTRYEFYKKKIRPMMFYPLAILVVSVFPITYRVLTFFNPKYQSSFILALLHAMSVPMWGLLFAVVYGIDPETRRELSVNNVKATIRNRLHGTRIVEFAVSIHLGKKPSTTTSDTTKTTLTTTERENFSLSNIIIDPSTIYPDT